MEWVCNKVPIYQPTMSQFLNELDCINVLGQDLGGRYAGIASIVPPPEWQTKMVPAAAVHEFPRVNFILS